MSDTVTDNQEINEPVEIPVVDETQNQVEQQEVIEEIKEEQKVPLSALQKERKKRQDLELENRYLKEYAVPKTQEKPVEDEVNYEPITKGEMDKKLAKERESTLRMAEERIWIKQNPEKAEIINEKLAEFLKIKPNLASAIEAAPNRYEEAWELMDKLSPKQKQALKPSATAKKDAPNSPSSVPKASNLNQTVDFMSMSDAEFRTWRQSVVKK